LVPETADISDIDTLRKYSTTLKIGGVINRQRHLVSDRQQHALPGRRRHHRRQPGRPTYLKMVALSVSEFTLGLNDATLIVPLKK